MIVELIEGNIYGVFQYSNEFGKECLFTGSWLECGEWMFYNN